MADIFAVIAVAIMDAWTPIVSVGAMGLHAVLTHTVQVVAQLPNQGSILPTHLSASFTKQAAILHIPLFCPTSPLILCVASNWTPPISCWILAVCPASVIGPACLFYTTVGV